MSTPAVDALLFDVFGTVVDWRGSVSREGQAFLRAQADHLKAGAGEAIDWDAFAREWHGDGYQAGLARIRRGEQPWTNVATLQRRKLDELLARSGFDGLDEASLEHFNRVWRRLAPWPDSVPGLARLKTRYILAPLSNGDFGMLVDLARFAGLPWDCVFAAEQFGHYKPEPQTYEGAIALLGLPPERVMLVAAHAYDLEAARTHGMRTAYVPRPAEHGADRSPEPKDPQPGFDLVVHDFLELADALGA
jgi:2-haloacid dehalogenase